MRGRHAGRRKGVTHTCPKSCLWIADDGIVTATFNRPRARNALTYEMYDGLGVLLAEIESDPEVQALVLVGAGGEAFAAGTAIAQFESLRSEADSLAYEGRIETLLSALERCRVPTIAALAGACTGGGAMIAACCDLRIASANLKFGFPIARTLGNCLSTQNLARLVALVGEARVKTMIFTARLIEIDEALVTGLVAEVVSDAEALGGQGRRARPRGGGAGAAHAAVDQAGPAPPARTCRAGRRHRHRLLHEPRFSRGGRGLRRPAASRAGRGGRASAVAVASAAAS